MQTKNIGEVKLNHFYCCKNIKEWKFVVRESSNDYYIMQKPPDDLELEKEYKEILLDTPVFILHKHPILSLAEIGRRLARVLKSNGVEI